MRGETFGTGLTECPQAGIRQVQPKPLDQRQTDKVEQLSQGGDDSRANTEYFCFPQNETSVAVNPTNPRNIVVGANDYRLGFGSSGFYATTDGGNHWYNGVTLFPSIPGARDHLDGGGDPAVVFDRAGVVYYAQIRFMRENDSNGIFVNRSTNGGFTWSRPCVALASIPLPPPPDPGRCGPPGDPRQPGDGTVTFFPDPDGQLNGSAPFDDKEYMAAGPRPAGVQPVSFRPFTREPFPTPAAVVGVDRLYVTWTRFEDNPAALFQFTANIMVSFSDDQGRSWSPERPISGNAPLCGFSVPAGNCDLNQFSVPSVNPATGHVYVAFENFNTPDENQILVVRSRDGGVTWEGPFFVTPVFDVNYPRAGAAGGRPDCTARGQQGGRAVLTNSCFRVPATLGFVADKRGGDFADDLYIVMQDNRNGTRASSNVDIFFFKSTDGGMAWIGPTRVNDDPLVQPADRECPPRIPDPEDPTRTIPNPECLPTAVFGNDQWFPWVDIGRTGDLVAVFHDRRLDTASTAHEHPTSRQRPGNYLDWFWGGQCSITTTATVTQTTTTIPAAARQCVAPEARVIPQPTAPMDIPPTTLFPQSAFPFKNFTISDTPSNQDYCFRSGIFCGDYENVAIGPDNQAWATWTDSRNGRSSRTQAGRNPACEQSDVFVDGFSAQSGGSPDKAKPTDELFLVTPCPTDAVDRGNRPP